IDWKNRTNRKPLVMRGARQVGKSHLVTDFGQRYFNNTIELNFDESPEKADLFQSSSLERVFELISIDAEQPKKKKKTLLFLDEIQRAPEVFAKLRYFYEKAPALHVIAAGSLLDFVLEEHSFSMPVGRIEYLFMGPMDFGEFMVAHGQDALLEYIRVYDVMENIPKSIHIKLLEWFRRYMAIGGMPAAVREVAENDSPLQAEQELTSIIQTYRDDFSKYKKRVSIQRLQMTMEKVPHLIGAKLKYVDICREERAKDLADTIRMLKMARVIHCAYHSSGNHLPLQAERKDNDYKPLFLDIGLVLRSLKMKMSNLLGEQMILANRGALAEQVVGQEWVSRHTSFEDPELFYWNREKKGSAAELDYLFEIEGQIIPVEVKAGTTGSLKSLQVFAAEKKSKVALRFNLDSPSVCKAKSHAITNSEHEFTLLSLPLYMVSEAPRLIKGL
ncbi:MAG: ATP-binding protein, partial [Planctomycetes bacterium]|nr:ATP-binding protein [Planctomycetota bacterium]